MKKRFRFLLFSLAILAVLSSCSRTVSFSIDRGGYRNGKTDVVYFQASDNYRSTKYSPDAFVGTYSDPKGNVTSFYHVEGLDGVLTDEDYQLYVSEGFSLPAFSEFLLASAALCMSDAITVPILEFDAANAERFRRSVLSGVSVDFSKVNQSLFGERYELVFFESDLPIAYRLIYQELSGDLLIYENLTADGEIPDRYPGIPAEKTIVNGKEYAVFHFGTQFLYDRSAQTCYPIEKLTSEGAS